MQFLRISARQRTPLVVFAEVDPAKDSPVLPNNTQFGEGHGMLELDGYDVDVIVFGSK
jgi:hypothetical protein